MCRDLNKPEYQKCKNFMFCTLFYVFLRFFTFFYGGTALVVYRANAEPGKHVTQNEKLHTGF